jgi:hypothetical protein
VTEEDNNQIETVLAPKTPYDKALRLYDCLKNSIIIKKKKKKKGCYAT